MRKKAFTLIELLVVIAIIGVLASIVIVSTRGAILKGKDTQVKSGLAQVKSIAEMIMSDQGNYNGLCASAGSLNTGHPTYGTQLGKIQTQIQTAQGGTLVLTCYTGNVAGDYRYCVSARLVSNTANYFCVDSKGNSIVTSSATACDNTNFDCD